jgi:hypothetical protein
MSMTTSQPNPERPAGAGRGRLLVPTVLLVGLVATATPRPAQAQNHNSVPLGGRTATMGGAATAAGNDSAMPYLNPSGLAGVPGDIFGVSATLYGYGETNYGKIFFPGSTPELFGTLVIDDQRATGRSLIELPSSVMYFRHLSKPDDSVQHRLGMSLIIPVAARQELIARVRARFPTTAVGPIEVRDSYAMTTNNTVYLFGPGYAVGWEDRLRLGVSLYGVYSQGIRNFSSSFQFLIPGGPMNSTVSSATQDNTYGFLPVVGGQVQVVNKLWVGLAGAPPSIWLSGRREASGSSSMGLVDSQGNGTTRFETTQLEGEATFHLPWRINAGVAYDDRDRFALAADVTLYGDQDPSMAIDYVQSRSQSQSGEVSRSVTVHGTTQERDRMTFNVAVGGEVTLSQLLALRAGGFTDFSPHRAIGFTDADVYSQRLDRYGATLGLGLKVGSFDTTVGLVGVYGKGKFGADNTFGMFNGEPPVIPVDITSQTLMFVLSGAVTVEEAKKTMKEALGVGYLPELPGTSTTEAEAWQPPPWGPVDLSGEGYRPADRAVPRAQVMPAEVPAPAPPAPPEPVVVVPPPCMQGEIDVAATALITRDYQGARTLLEPAVARCRAQASRTELARGLLYLGIALSALNDQQGAKAAWTEAAHTDPLVSFDERITDAKVRKRFEAVKREVEAAPTPAPAGPPTPTPNEGARP